MADDLVGPEELDEIYAKLRNLDVEIVDHAEVDRIKQSEPDADDDKAPHKDRLVRVAPGASIPAGWFFLAWNHWRDSVEFASL